MPKTYTVKQVADILGFSTNSIYSFLKAKRIKGVRAGKGRFRIPETELARVLQLSKKSVNTEVFQPSQVTNTPQQSQPIGDDRMLEDTESETLARGFMRKILSLPNLFDWFVGLSAIISGLGLFLFNHVYSPSGTVQFATVLPAVRIILIVAGLGILLADILPKSRAWHQTFLFILSTMGIFNSYILWVTGDIDGAMLYGLLAILVGINALVHFGGVFSLALYLTLLGLVTPVLYWFGDKDIHINSLIKFLNISYITAFLGMSVLAGLFLLMFLGGYRKNSVFFWIASWLAAILLVAAAVFNGQIVYWSRAFFLLTFAFFVAFMPIWRLFQYANSKRERLLIHGMFALVGMTMMIAIGVVHILQIGVWEQNKKEFTAKLNYAESMVSSALESVESSLIASSTNPDLLDAIADSDESRLVALSKVVYESNSFIRRLVFLSSDGDGIALYPLGTFDEPNFAYREYFRIARDTGKPYTSNVFEARSDNEQRKVIVVAVPFINKSNFVGVMTASVNILALGEKLQRVAVGSGGEYFLIVDEEGKIVIAPETTSIGASIAESDLLRRALIGEQGVALDRLDDGELGMVAYRKFSNSPWALSLRAPASRVYTIGQSAVASVFAVVGLIMLTSLLFLSTLQIRVKRPREASP